MEKECTRCHTVKPREQFYRQTRVLSGLQPWCKDCTKAHRTADYAKHRDKRVATMRRNTLRREYGMTPEQWDAMFAEQGGVCAICRAVPTKTHTDHCHTTGKVRGILCERCNHMIGHAKDRPDVLRLGADYLEKS